MGKKVVVQALSGLHHSGIVLPLVFISGNISSKEYAKGLMIREGENDTLEFKSTLRWDIRAGKTNPCSGTGMSQN